MKDLAKLKIGDADPRIKKLTSNEIDERIDLIYSLGYVYNPYDKEFFNPFIYKKIKTSTFCDLKADSIKKLHQNLENAYLKKNNEFRSSKEIKNHIYKDRPFQKVGFYLDSLSGILGLILLILTVIFHIMGNVEIATGLMLSSFILIDYYLYYNLLFAKNEDEYQLGPLWLNYKNFFLILSLALYPYSYFLLLLTTDSFWIPLIIILPISYLIRKLITKKHSKNYWQMTGINSINDYAKEKGFF